MRNIQYIMRFCDPGAEDSPPNAIEEVRDELNILIDLLATQTVEWSTGIIDCRNFGHTFGDVLPPPQHAWSALLQFGQHLGAANNFPARAFG